MSNDEQSLDVPSLEAYLTENLDEFQAPLRAEKFAGGQSNPTYLLTSANGKYVLRRKPPGKLLKSAHAVDREYRVMRALAETPVPVPTMHLLCDDDTVIGSMFFVMEHVDGRILWNAALPELERSERGAVYDAMNDVLAKLHSVDVEAVGLADFGKPGNYFARQLSRWTGQYRASETETIPEMDELIVWLEEQLPADDGISALIHGDYRLDNMILHPKDSRIVAVLDWELSTLGHPYADLAYQCMQLRIPADFTLPGLGNVDRDALGIPSEDAYVARYCERRGIGPIENWDFYVAFSFFRLAAILQGIMKRYIDGTASSEKAQRYGRMARPLAEFGRAMID